MGMAHIISLNPSHNGIILLCLQHAPQQAHPNDRFDETRCFRDPDNIQVEVYLMETSR